MHNVCASVLLIQGFLLLAPANTSDSFNLKNWIAISASSNGEVQQAIERCETGEGYVRLSDDVRDEYHTLLELEPPTFLQHFDNPCWIECLPTDRNNIYPKNLNLWYRDTLIPELKKTYNLYQDYREKWRLRCLPKFYLIGMAKCGTSELFARIAEHPDVAVMGAKELNWWGGLGNSLNDLYNFERYLDQCDIGAMKVLKSARYDPLENHLKRPVIFGDATPSTIFKNAHWEPYRNSSGFDDVLMTPKVMSRIQPDAKVIVILRNPVFMVYSAYKFFSVNIKGVSPEHFHHCVIWAIKTQMECMEQYDDRMCVHADFIIQGPYYDCRFVLRSLKLGHYAVLIEEWLDYFSLKQMYIVNLEQYARHHLTTIQDIWKFLGLDPISLKKKKYLLSSDSRRNTGSHYSEPMLKKSEELLRSYFAKPNTRLAKLLNNPKFRWQ